MKQKLSSLALTALLLAGCGTSVVNPVTGQAERTVMDESAEIAEGSDIEVYSPDSPIGTAIIGAKVGDKVSFFAPNGKEREIEILEVKNFLG